MSLGYDFLCAILLDYCSVGSAAYNCLESPAVPSTKIVNRLLGVEVKAAATLSANDVRGLLALETAAGKHWVRGVVFYTGTEVIPFSANLHGVPMSRLWSD